MVPETALTSSQFALNNRVAINDQRDDAFRYTLTSQSSMTLSFPSSEWVDTIAVYKWLTDTHPQTVVTSGLGVVAPEGLKGLNVALDI